MKNMIMSLLENALEDIPEKIDEVKYDDPEKTAYPDVAYAEAVKMINEKYKKYSDQLTEIAVNVHDDLLKADQSKKIFVDGQLSVKIHAFAMNPVIRLMDKNEMLKSLIESRDNELLDDEKIIYRLAPHIRVSGFDPVKIKDIILHREIEVNNVTYVLLVENAMKCHKNITILRDELYNVRSITISELATAKTTKDINTIVGVACRAYKLYLTYALAYAVAANELLSIFNSRALVESASEEDAVQYVSELNKLIPEIRKFYDEFKYKEIVTPRKKHIEKMNEYMLGALNRQYKLKIPVYKIVGKSTDVKDLIESTFIKPLEKIVHKYPNFILLTPDFSDDADMFIYVTLKEPFGDKEDRDDREDQSKEALNEAALTTAQRKALPDEIFGLPGRKYPLNDRTRIRDAIRKFNMCSPENKDELAKNIVKQIIKQNLVGKITIASDNENNKYFPAWMQHKDAKLMSDKNNRYKIIVDGKTVSTGSLVETVSNIAFIL